MSDTLTPTYTQERIAKFRLMADFIETHHDKFEAIGNDLHGSVSFDVYGWITVYLYSDDDEKPDTAEKMAAIRRMFGGQWDKEFSGDTLTIKRMFDTPDENFRVRISVNASRESACKKKFVGVTTKEVKDIDAAPMKTVEVDLFEWDCGSILSDD